MSKGTSAVARVIACALLPIALWACSKSREEVVANANVVAADGQIRPAFASSASPGVVPCGSVTCPSTKSARRVCCNAPGVPPMCRNADRCGQATKFRYSGMLSCNETADCRGTEPGKDAVCCLSDDGFRADGVPGPYDRAVCSPRTACVGNDIVACVTDSECAKGTHCRAISMGVGIDVGGCLP